MSDETTHMSSARYVLLMNEKFEELRRQFVESLEGRYRAHVSDEYLVAHLAHELYGIYFRRLSDSITNKAYDAACIVFESILERRCKAGGNGHHVAQDYSKLFNDFEDGSTKTG
jgi:hypothetical protein